MNKTTNKGGCRRRKKTHKKWIFQPFCLSVSLSLYLSLFKRSHKREETRQKEKEENNFFYGFFPTATTAFIGIGPVV